MLSILAVIIIHSSPLDEVAKISKLIADEKQEQAFSLQGGKTIVVKKFEFSGNNAIPVTQLQRITRPYLNKTLSESSLSAIKQRIEILYKSKGYTQVKVSIPAKQKEGSLTFVIKEGKKS